MNIGCLDIGALRVRVEEIEETPSKPCTVAGGLVN